MTSTSLNRALLACVTAVTLSCTAAGASAATPTTTAAADAKAKTTLSAECQAQVDQAKAEHKRAVESGTAGSSFMGPKELAQGVLNGYGSSGMPQEPECVEQEKEENKDAQIPEWAASMRSDGSAAETVQWLGTVVTVLGMFVQVLTVAAKFSPELLNDIKNALASVGVR